LIFPAWSPRNTAILQQPCCTNRGLLKLAVASGALSLERCKELHAAFQKQRGASSPATANELARGWSRRGN